MYISWSLSPVFQYIAIPVILVFHESLGFFYVNVLKILALPIENVNYFSKHP